MSYGDATKATLITRVVALASVLAVVTGTCVASAASQDGFGNGGFATWGSDYGPSAVGVQMSGRIVIDDGGAVSALTPAGGYDRSFSAPGDVFAHAHCRLCDTGLAVQPDDGIIVFRGDTVVRLTPTGSLDRSFGTGGRVSVPNIDIESVALAPGGGIVVAGAEAGPNGDTGGIGSPSRVARLLPTGILDPSFGRTGSVALDARVGWPVAVAVQADGRVIVVGREGGSRISRLNLDGSFDSAFGEQGLTGIPGLRGSAIVVQPDGKIVVAGVEWPPNAAAFAVVARFDDLGHADGSFGTEGVYALRGSGYSPVIDLVAGLGLQADGAVIAVGGTVPTCPCKGESWFVQKLTPDGQAGKPPPYLGPDLVDPDHDCWGEGANAVAVQRDGKVVVAGSACGTTGVVARYTPDLLLDAGTPLLISRIRPQGTAAAEAARAKRVVRVSAVVTTNANAHLAVSVRRARRMPGIKAPTPTGARVTLLPGTSLAQVTLPLPALTVEADVPRSRQVQLRLLLPAVAFPPGQRGLATVRATDDRGRTAIHQIEFVAR